MSPRRVSLRGLIGLWLLAVVLLTAQSGELPLRDWDESLVARVALEISQRNWPDNLLPTLWNQPYLNKPPLLHGLIAAVISVWSVLMPEAAASPPPTWLIRLVPALLSSLVVPLVGLVQARLRPQDRLAPLTTAAVALTLLPLMRHGRLAMLDGTLISAMTLQWWALLSLQRPPGDPGEHRWSVLAGLAGSVILLLKAPAAIPLLIGGCGLLAREQRWGLQRWRHLAAWMAIGLLPGVGWHLWDGLERGFAAFNMWGGQGLARLVDTVEGHSGGIAVPITEVLEGGWPWLVLWPLAMLAAYRHRRSRWGFWVLGLTLLTAALVLPLHTQLPWYSHLLWPSFALAVGPLFSELVRRDSAESSGSPTILRRIPWLWLSAGVSVLALREMVPAPATVTIPAGMALTLGGGMLLTPSLPWRRWGAITLVALLWLALLGLFRSRLWLWELNEAWPVLPVAQELRARPTNQRLLPVLVAGPDRPSLEWYVGRELGSGNIKRRLQLSQERSLLVISEQPPSVPQWQCSELISRASTPSLFLCNRQQPAQVDP